MLVQPDSSLALVTGASRRGGIGAAICRALAAESHDIFFTHWQPFDRGMPWGADEDGPAALANESAGPARGCRAPGCVSRQPNGPVGHRPGNSLRRRHPALRLWAAVLFGVSVATWLKLDRTSPATGVPLVGGDATLT